MKLEDLKIPFPVTDIEWRVGSVTKDGKKGTALAYLTNRAIMDRLDAVVNPENWRNEFKEWKGGQLCGISIKIVEEWITKWDGADDSKIEPLKGGLSDSMKRAAVQWGIGRYLYNLDTQWIELDEWKHLTRIPPLPAWALPAGTVPANVTPPTQTPPKATQTPPAPKEQPKTDDNSTTISDFQRGELSKLARTVHKTEETAIKCLKELLQILKIEKMNQIPKDKMTYCNEFITMWDDTDLPFTLAPEGE